MAQVKGLKELLTKLKKLGKEVQEDVDALTFDAANKIKTQATYLAPRGVSNQLVTGIGVEKVSDMTYKVVASAPYSAYVEFGTGPKVNVPAELSDVASEIKAQGSKGSFDDALFSIKLWCKLKGIDESAAFPILMSILRNGLTPRPFLYPAFVEGRVNYIKDLEDLLEALTDGI